MEDQAGGTAPSAERPPQVMWKQWGLTGEALEVQEKRGHRSVKANHRVQIS